MEITGEIGTSGQFESVSADQSASTAVARAVELEHSCDLASCDICAAMASDCPMSAAHLLTGATETPLLDKVMEHFQVSATETPSDWPEWLEAHREYGRECHSCGAFNYGDDFWTPEVCDNCGNTLDARKSLSV